MAPNQAETANTATGWRVAGNRWSGRTHYVREEDGTIDGVPMCGARVEYRLVLKHGATEPTCKNCLAGKQAR